MIDNVFPEKEECPDCGGFIFRPGPRGGMSQNIECVGCGARFNITRWDPAMTTQGGPMPIVWAERIGHTGQWREDLFPKVLQ
jgi:hypothetical protein